MLISIIIIKLIINLILGLYFKTENLFDAQFDEFEKMYIINSHKKYLYDYLLCFHILVYILFIVEFLVYNHI